MIENFEFIPLEDQVTIDDLFSSPEIDTRYYINNLDYLEKVLKAI